VVKFVVVDDDEKELNHIKKLLEAVVKEDKKIMTFSKVCNELKEEIQNTDEHKIYILDIELGALSGISIAKLIRNVDYESEIIFITNHDKMFESAYRSVYEVFDFIEKFHEFDARLKKDIKEILKRKFDNKMFVYKSCGIELNLHYKNILYIYREKEDRKLIIVTDNNEYVVNMGIKDIFEYLDGRFRQCHRSCIVNIGRVQEKNYKDKYIVFDNGKRVDMLSKKYKSELEYE